MDGSLGSFFQRTNDRTRKNSGERDPERAVDGCLRVGDAAVHQRDAVAECDVELGAANDNGNLQGSTFVHAGGTLASAVTFSQTYGYDNVNRLMSVTDTTPGASGAQPTTNYSRVG